MLFLWQRQFGASVIDILANSKIRSDGVKRMTQIQNTSQSFAETKYFRVAAREHTGTGRHRAQIAHFFRGQIGSWWPLGIGLVVGSRLRRIRWRLGPPRALEAIAK